MYNNHRRNDDRIEGRCLERLDQYRQRGTEEKLYNGPSGSTFNSIRKPDLQNSWSDTCGKVLKADERRHTQADERCRDRLRNRSNYTQMSGRIEDAVYREQYERKRHLVDFKDHHDFIDFRRRQDSYHIDDNIRVAKKCRRESRNTSIKKENKLFAKSPRHQKSRRKRKKMGQKKASISQSSPSSISQPKQVTGVVSDDDENETETGSLTNKNRKNGQSHASDSRKNDRSNSCVDDTIGHFRGANGDVITERYRVVREVGIGTFGRVLECLDLKRRLNTQTDRIKNRNPYVAIKIVRNVKRYFESALIEAKIIAQVNRHGGRGLSHCVILHESFSLGGHYCLVFESLGPSLFDFLKRHHYKPFPMICVQDFTIQLLEALEFLHSLRLIHTDLKIENILLTNNREVMYRNCRVPESTKIKIIDFGGACYDCDKKSSVINTRQYRAPEVILGIGWSMPSDIWSAGCILSELYSGDLLFPTHDNIEHLALIERRIGHFPLYMVKEAIHNANNDNARQAFDSRGRHCMGTECSAVRRLPRLEHIIHDHDVWFLGLLRQMLRIDPTNRATAHECLNYLSQSRRDIVSFNAR